MKTWDTNHELSALVLLLLQASSFPSCLLGTRPTTAWGALLRFQDGAIAIAYYPM